jgi:hypothetical protein
MANRDGRMVDRRSLLLVAAGTAAFLVGRARAAQPVGSVEEVRGQAFAEARTGRRALDRAAPLFIDDLVETEGQSRLTLHLGKDTTLKLGENARLKIDRFLVNAGGELTLGAGPLVYDHPAGRPPSGLSIRSTFGLIAVRGTRFFAGPSNGVFGIFVERGSVAVTAAGARVTLHEGEGTNIASTGASPTPPRPWGPARIKSAFDSVE